MSETIDPVVIIWAEGSIIFNGILHRFACFGGIGRLAESGSVEIPFSTFEEISKAKRVEISISAHRFTLNKEAQGGFQELMDFLR